MNRAANPLSCSEVSRNEQVSLDEYWYLKANVLIFFTWLNGLLGKKSPGTAAVSVGNPNCCRYYGSHGSQQSHLLSLTFRGTVFILYTLMFPGDTTDQGSQGKVYHVF